MNCSLALSKEQTAALKLITGNFHWIEVDGSKTSHAVVIIRDFVPADIRRRVLLAIEAAMWTPEGIVQMANRLVELHGEIEAATAEALKKSKKSKNPDAELIFGILFTALGVGVVAMTTSALSRQAGYRQGFRAGLELNPNDAARVGYYNGHAGGYVDGMAGGYVDGRVDGLLDAYAQPRYVVGNPAPVSISIGTGT